MNTYPRQSSEQERFRDPSELSDDERELYLYLEQEFELMPQVLDADQQFIEEALQLSEADQ